MDTYDFSNQIYYYDLFYQELNTIETNEKNQFAVMRHSPIGFSSCGFPLEHYSIGYGPRHVVYMAGAHGNEIIGVSYVLEFMKNLALKKGEFVNFRPDLFTIDFLPIQNPEGYFTTTYALLSVLKDKNEEEKKKFIQDYFLAYRTDNEQINQVNEIIRLCCASCSEDFIVDAIHFFWASSFKTKIGREELSTFLSQILHQPEEVLWDQVSFLWNERLGTEQIDTFKKEYQNLFSSLSIDCIPEIDANHIRLKKKLQKLYQDEDYPMCTLANFLANADGINLNDNNPYYFEILKEQVKKEKVVYANPMYLYPKSKLGPIGTVSASFEKFSYAPENEALFRFLESLGNSNYAFFNLHGTGGMLYAEPFCDDRKEHANIHDFSFYINNRIATEYLKGIEEVYQSRTGKKDSYVCMPYPKRITGTSDMLRSKCIGHFLLELSKSGGNPIGPYVEPNYTFTMEANFRAFRKTLDTILEVEHLYDKMYEIKYDGKGNVLYEEKSRKRVWKKDCC